MRYLVRFPEGIPSYSSRHGPYVWSRTMKPVMQIHNDWDLFWIKQGEATWEFRDGRRMVAGRDQFAILPPYVSALISESRPELIFWYWHFNFRVVMGNFPKELRADFVGPGASGLLMPLTFSAKEAPAVARAHAAMRRLNLHPTHPAVQREAEREAWRLERATIALVAELAEFAKRTGSPKFGTLIETSEEGDPRVASICAKINAAPQQAWRVTDLADEVGLSTGRLHNLCRRVTGQSLKGYIVRARLLQALRLLKERPNGRLASIKEVSAACGFSSQHFFSRQFKSHFRITPLAYRSGASLA